MSFSITIRHLFPRWLHLHSSWGCVTVNQVLLCQLKLRPRSCLCHVLQCLTMLLWKCGSCRSLTRAFPRELNAHPGTWKSVQFQFWQHVKTNIGSSTSLTLTTTCKRAKYVILHIQLLPPHGCLTPTTVTAKSTVKNGHVVALLGRLLPTAWRSH